MVAKSFSGSLQSLELIGGMLSPNPQEQPKLEDFKIKKEEIQAPVPEKEKNEAMIEEESDAEIQDATEELKIILSNDMRMMNFSPDPKMYSAEMRSPGDSSATRSQNVQRGGYQQSNGAAYQGGNTPADSRTNQPTSVYQKQLLHKPQQQTRRGQRTDYHAQLTQPETNLKNVQPYQAQLTVQNLKDKLDDFMRLDPEKQRNILGELLYLKILRKSRPEHAPKITGMLVDLEVLTVQDILEMLEDDQILDERIHEALDLVFSEGQQKREDTIL